MAPTSKPTLPPGAEPTAADVADKYMQALTELRLEVVRQGELTRLAMNNRYDDLDSRVEELEALAAE